MKLTTLLALLAISAGAYQYWHRQQLAAAEADATDGNGFVALPAPAGVDPGQVLVLAAENCPKEGAQRADALAEQLAANGIPFTRAHHVNFMISNPDQAQLERLNATMNGDAPVVFVNGRGKANPTLEEVLEEYGGGN